MSRCKGAEGVLKVFQLPAKTHFFGLMLKSFVCTKITFFGHTRKLIYFNLLKRSGGRMTLYIVLAVRLSSNVNYLHDVSFIIKNDQI